MSVLRKNIRKEDRYCVQEGPGGGKNIWIYSKDKEEWYVSSGFFMITYRDRDKEHNNNNRPDSLKGNNHFQDIRSTFDEHFLFFFSLSTFPSDP